MKKTVLLLFAMIVSGSVFSQKQETVHVKDINCKYDTTAKFYEDANLVIDSPATKNLSVSGDGKNKILILKITTSECECTDCSEVFQFAINTDSLEMNKPMNLNSANLTWVYDNSWIEPKYITSYLGNITQTGKNNYTLKLSELLGTSVIRSINISVKAN